MSDPPLDRVMNNARAFTNTSVVYFGPFETKMFRRTAKKCLFKCLSVRAVHIELVDSFHTTSSLDAVHRFIERRGQPKTIILNNGTNFVGAAREFQECFAELQRDKITVKLSESDIKWSKSTSSASLWWSLGKIGTFLQKSAV